MGRGDIIDTLDQPHDKYFKATFGTVNFARDFLDNYLSKEGGELVMSVAERLRQEGIEKGESKALVKTTIRLLTKKFGPLTEDDKAKLEDLDNLTLEKIIDGILDYESLDDINKALKQKKF